MSIFRLSLAISLLSIALPVAAKPLALPNPGFEAGLEGWNVGGGDNGMSVASTQAARSGQGGLRVSDFDASAGSSLYSRRLPCHPAEGYHLRFSARLVEGSGVGVYLHFFDNSGKLIRPSDRFVASLRQRKGAAAWHAISLYAVAPEGAAQMAVWVHSYASARVVADFDDFTLEAIPKQEAEAAIAVAEAKKKERNPVELPKFDKENPEQFLAQMKVLQPDGTALRAAREDWQGARQRINSDARWKTWFEQCRTEVDGWMERHQDRVQWRAGWWHDFVSPKDGSFLTWTEDIPGEDVDYLFSASDPRVEITPKIFDGWVFGFRKRHMQKILDAARLWRLTGETRYRDWAIAQIDFYADNYEQWPLHTSKGWPARLSFQSLDEAVNLVTLTDAARLLLPDISEAHKRAWFEQLFRPEATLLEAHGLRIHNIPTWHRSAAAQVALLFGDEELWRSQVDGPFGIRDQLARGVTSDYVWYEQAMGYNRYILTALNPFFTFVGLMGREKELAYEGAVAQGLMLSPLRLRFADGTIPNPADAHRPLRSNLASLGFIYRTLPTYAGLLEAQGKLNWDTLLDPPGDIIAALPDAALLEQRAAHLPEVSSVSLESTREALLRKDPWQVFLHYGQLGVSHSQQEALNYSASFEGRDVTHDPGTVGYGSPMHANYYQRALNHNVPLINGLGQQQWRRGELLDFDAQAASVRASQPDYNPHGSAQRSLQIEGDILRDVTEVLYEGVNPEGAKFALALHVQGKLQLSDGFKPADDFPQMVRASLEGYATRSEGKAETVDEGYWDYLLRPFSYWKDVRYAHFTDEVTLELTLAAEGDSDQRLLLTIRTEGGFTVFVGASPDYPPLFRTGIYVALDSPAKKATFITEFAPAN